MRVFNQHKINIPKPLAEVGELLKTLASDNDKLWPTENWPKIYFDKALQVGAKGGHKPIQYEITKLIPKQFIQFKFSAPAGFDGYHQFSLSETEKGHCEISHTIEMNVAGKGIATWYLVILHLHNALLRDLLAKAQASLELEPVNNRWNLWVKCLRWSLSGGKSKPQQLATLNPN